LYLQTIDFNSILFLSAFHLITFQKQFRMYVISFPSELRAYPLVTTRSRTTAIRAYDVQHVCSLLT
jgi:hypothetical protein